jgi:hypothetical protein
MPMTYDQPTPCPFCGKPVTDDQDAATLLWWDALTDIDGMNDHVAFGSNFHMSCAPQLTDGTPYASR